MELLSPKCFNFHFKASLGENYHIFFNNIQAWMVNVLIPVFQILIISMEIAAW